MSVFFSFCGIFKFGVHPFQTFQPRRIVDFTSLQKTPRHRRDGVVSVYVVQTPSPRFPPNSTNKISNWFNYFHTFPSIILERARENLKLLLLLPGLSRFSFDFQGKWYRQDSWLRRRSRKWKQLVWEVLSFLSPSLYLSILFSCFRCGVRRRSDALDTKMPFGRSDCFGQIGNQTEIKKFCAIKWSETERGHFWKGGGRVR